MELVTVMVGSELIKVYKNVVDMEVVDEYREYGVIVVLNEGQSFGLVEKYRSYESARASAKWQVEFYKGKGYETLLIDGTAFTSGKMTTA